MSLILGIDPGSRLCGYGLIEAAGNRLTFVDCGFIEVAELAFPLRLKQIYDRLGEVIRQYGPQVAAIEEVFMGKNAASALKLGQARGAAMLACANLSLEIAEYSTSKVKQAVVGSGRAEKRQVQHMIGALLSLPSAPQADAADALAVAVCHAHTQSTLIRMAGVRSTRGGRWLALDGKAGLRRGGAG